MYTVSPELLTQFAPISDAMSNLLSQFPEAAKRFEERNRHWEVALATARKHGIVGMVLKALQREQWVFISPDAETGKFRYSAFDAQGFFGHGVRETAEKVLVDVFVDGFEIVESPTKLDEMAATWEAAHV